MTLTLSRQNHIRLKTYRATLRGKKWNRTTTGPKTGRTAEYSWEVHGVL